MRTAAFALCLSLLLAATGLSAQTIYKTTDAQGNVVFTDKPPGDRNAEQVELRPMNTTPSVPVPARTPDTERKAADDDAESAPEVAITSPENESTIPMGGGDFGVFASVTPAVGPGQSLQLLIDGEAWGGPQNGGAWQLSNIMRGPHDLTVQLLDSGGAAIASSTSVRVYVLRPSVLNPAHPRN